METTPLTRLDDHTNDRVETEEGFTDANKDDFLLFSSNATSTNAASTNSLSGWLREPYRNQEDLLIPNPYGIWANGITN